MSILECVRHIPLLLALLVNCQSFSSRGKIAFFIVSVTATADAFLFLLLFQHTVVTYAGLFGGYTRRM